MFILDNSYCVTLKIYNSNQLIRTYIDCLIMGLLNQDYNALINIYNCDSMPISLIIYLLIILIKMN